jgi:hypothetical protein
MQDFFWNYQCWFHASAIAGSWTVIPTNAFFYAFLYSFGQKGVFRRRGFFSCDQEKEHCSLWGWNSVTKVRWASLLNGTYSFDLLTVAL